MPGFKLTRPDYHHISCIYGFEMAVDKSKNEDKERFFGRWAGRLYLLGLGACLLAPLAPERFEDRAVFVALLLLSFGLMADGIDDVLDKRIDSFDGDIVRSRSPLMFFFAALLPFSLASVIAFLLIQLWVFPDFSKAIPALSEWVLPELLFFGVSTMFLSSACTAHALGVIRIGKRSFRVRLRRAENPLLFFPAVAFEFFLSFGAAWVYFKLF